MQQNKRQTGAAYEEQAARFLLEQGYQILERNYRCRQGEIDVIARDGSYLVFVEVKYRSSRFDVVSILGDQTELVKHAFEVQRL